MRLYDALLRLYPASFRAEYGEEMRRLFARRRRDAQGAGAVAALWLGTAFDVAASALRTHLDILRQDLRFAARALSRAPGFALTAILVAAVGIGAATASYSVLDHVLVRPLPFPGADRLVDLWENDTEHGYGRTELSPANYRDWKSAARSFDGMAAYTIRSSNLAGEGTPERLEGAAATPELFGVLRVRAALGRVLTADDGRPGAEKTVLISDALWRRRFGSDPDVLGRKLLLDDAPHVVVGVMPPDFRFPGRDADVWTPLAFGASDYEDREDCYLKCVARLKPGVSVEKVRTEMRLVAAQLERAYPKENRRIGATVLRLRDEIAPESRWLLMALFGAAVGVLLIGCTNLASLLLARAIGRRRELAVRTAMGAGRERLVRQLLTESLVIAACAGAVGVLLAAAAGPLVARLVPNALPIAENPPLDLRMLAIAAVLTAATGIGFGVVPARRACREAAGANLHEDSRTGSGRATERLRAALVVAEVTASIVLLVSSGLLLRALWKLQGTDPGFRSEGVLALRTVLPMPRYEKTEERQKFYDRVLTQARGLPGVTHAAYISFLPMVARGMIQSVFLEGHTDGRDDGLASLRFVTPDYFAAMGIPVKAGRDVAPSDTAASPFVAVVSESFVKRYWPGQGALGRRFRFGQADRTVVGVVGDVRVRGLEGDSEPQVYVPSRQVPDGNYIGYVPRDLVIRSAVPAATLLPELRQIVAQADPLLPVSDVRPLSDLVASDTAPRRIQARALAAFAAVALGLAALGIHGLLSFTVSQRSREIGVRMALGATPRDILEMVLGRSAVLAGAGALLGGVLALGAAFAMRALLAGVSPADTATFGAAIGLAAAMTAAGSALPALRAVRVDPVTAIRTD
ncbi:MAG TPA: ABC transporter permease [Thermoanaerobaculia bacterium]|jgi:putative ABC transport system permease protein